MRLLIVFECYIGVDSKRNSRIAQEIEKKINDIIIKNSYGLCEEYHFIFVLRIYNPESGIKNIYKPIKKHKKKKSRNDHFLSNGL